MFVEQRLVMSGGAGSHVGKEKSADGEDLVHYWGDGLVHEGLRS